MYHPTLEEFRKLKNQGNLVPIYREMAVDAETPLSAFLKVKRGDYSFLLESVEGDEARHATALSAPSPIGCLSLGREIRLIPSTSSPRS